VRPGTGRRWGRGVAAGLVLGTVGVGDAVGQDLWSDVHEFADGVVRFEYEARAGLCARGERGDEGVIRLASGGRRGEAGPACEEGPVRIELRMLDGEVVDLDLRIGGEWPVRSRPPVDLGTVAPDRAAAFLFRLAESSATRAGERAVFPATIARGVVAWPRLLEIARGRALPAVRRQAVFWLGQEASDRATEGLASIIADEREMEVREHAIFALAQRDGAGAVDALIRVARDNPEPALRRQAIFWLGQRGDDPRVLDFLEEILRGGG